MIEKIKPGCPSTTLPCDFGDSITFMEQEAKNTLKLQETDETLEKLKGTVDTLDKECVKKIAPNSVTGVSIYASLDSANNPELHEDKNAELVADSITDKNGVFPPTVEFGDVVRRTPSGVVCGATADVDPEGVEHEQPLAYVNIETLKKKLLALENMLRALLSGKANVIPRPAEGTLIYATHSGRDSDQPYGIKVGTKTLEKYSIVVRNTDGQINAPNQATHEPGDDQYVSKRWMKNNSMQLKNTTAKAAVPCLNPNSSSVSKWYPIKASVYDEGNIPVRESSGHLYDLYWTMMGSNPVKVVSRLITADEVTDKLNDAVSNKVFDGLNFQDMGFPISALNGTFTESQEQEVLDICSHTYPAYIYHNKDIYYKTDTTYENGYVNFVHMHYDNAGGFQHNVITINTNTFSWALTIAV